MTAQNHKMSPVVSSVGKTFEQAYMSDKDNFSSFSPKTDKFDEHNKSIRSRTSSLLRRETNFNTNLLNRDFKLRLPPAAMFKKRLQLRNWLAACNSS